MQPKTIIIKHKKVKIIRLTPTKYTQRGIWSASLPTIALLLGVAAGCRELWVIGTTLTGLLARLLNLDLSLSEHNLILLGVHSVGNCCGVGKADLIISCREVCHNFKEVAFADILVNWLTFYEYSIKVFHSSMGLWQFSNRLGWDWRDHTQQPWKQGWNLWWA